MFFFFKQKTAYEMRISDWSSDVCSSDLPRPRHPHQRRDRHHQPVDFAAEQGGVDRAVAIEIPFEREVVVGRLGRAQIRIACRTRTVADLRQVARQVEIGIEKIGRASCRERVCQYVSISVVDVTLKKIRYDQLLNKVSTKKRRMTPDTP